MDEIDLQIGAFVSLNLNGVSHTAVIQEIELSYPNAVDYRNFRGDTIGRFTGYPSVKVSFMVSHENGDFSVESHPSSNSSESRQQASRILLDE